MNARISKGKIAVRKFFAQRKLIILLLSLITSLTLICFSVFGLSETPKPLSWLNDFTSMFARVVSMPGNVLMNFGDSITDIQNTYTENQHLKKQIASLQELKSKNAILKAENAELSALLKLKDQLESKKLVAGSVISRSPDYWNDYLIIDLGSNNGVKTQMSVMTPNGLIGRVIEVQPTSAKVQLISGATESSVEVAASVQVDDEIIHGVIKSYDKKNGELLLTQVPTDHTIKKGSLVVTSGLSGVSPEGLMIGEVLSAQADQFGISQTVRVKPAADFNDVRHVYVVLSENRKAKVDEKNDQMRGNEADASDKASSSDSQTEAKSGKEDDSDA